MNKNNQNQICSLLVQNRNHGKMNIIQSSPITPSRTPYKPCGVIFTLSTIIWSLNQITGGRGLQGARAGEGGRTLARLLSNLRE